MKYIGMPMGMWVLFAGSFQKQLTAVLGYGADTAKAITKKAKPQYSHPAKALPAKGSCGRSPYPASASYGRWEQRHCTGHSCTPVGQRGNRPFPPHRG